MSNRRSRLARLDEQNPAPGAMFQNLQSRFGQQLLPSTQRALHSRLAVEQSTCRAPSITASVLRRSETLWSDVWGMAGEDQADDDVQYRIGSITKTFVAALVLKLRDEGLLALEDRMEKYAPGSPISDRTLLHLLSHASGLQSEAPGAWWERAPGRDWSVLAGELGSQSVKHPAGRRYHYSNPGMALLGLVVERTTGKPWFEALQEKILLPLGMERTTYHPARPHAQGYAVHPYADVLLPEPHTDTKAMAPAGQLWSTVVDLGRWCRFLAGETNDVLSPTTVAEMRHPVTVDVDADGEMSGYGLGLQVYQARGRRLVGHGGSMPGFLAEIAVDVDAQLAAVTLANVTSGLSGVLHLDLLDIITEHEPPIPAQWRPVNVPPAVLEIVGPWYWGPRPHILRAVAGDWLDLSPASGSRAARFRPHEPDSWVGVDGYYAGETLRVARREDGSVSHLDIGTFCFTRSPYDPSAPIPGGLPRGGWHASGATSQAPRQETPPSQPNPPSDWDS